MSMSQTTSYGLSVISSTSPSNLRFQSPCQHKSAACSRQTRRSKHSQTPSISSLCRCKFKPRHFSCFHLKIPPFFVERYLFSASSNISSIPLMIFSVIVSRPHLCETLEYFMVRRCIVENISCFFFHLYGSNHRVLNGDASLHFWSNLAVWLRGFPHKSGISKNRKLHIKIHRSIRHHLHKFLFRCFPFSNKSGDIP